MSGRLKSRKGVRVIRVYFEEVSSIFSSDIVFLEYGNFDFNR